MEVKNGIVKMNGYGREVLAMTPEELLDDLIDESGPDYLSDIPRKEAIAAVAGWQQRTKDWFKND